MTIAATIDNIEQLGVGHSLLLPGQKAMLRGQEVCGCLRCHGMNQPEVSESRFWMDGAGRIVGIMEDVPGCLCCAYKGKFLIEMTSGASAVNHAAFIATVKIR